MHADMYRVTHLPRNSIDMSFQMPACLNPIWNPGNLAVSSCSVLPAYSPSHLRGHPWAKSTPCIHLDQNRLDSKNRRIRSGECLIHWEGLMTEEVCRRHCAMLDSLFSCEACISASVFFFKKNGSIFKQQNYITGVCICKINEMIHMYFSELYLS